MVTAPNRSSTVWPTVAEPLLRQPVAGVGRHGLAQRAQHVLAQRRGVLRAGQPGALVGGQRRGQAPQPAGHRRRCRTMTPSSKRAPRVAERSGGGGSGGVGDRAWPRRSPRSAGAAPPARSGWRWPPRSGSPARRRAAGSTPAAASGSGSRGVGVGLQAAPQHRAERVLAAGDGGVVFEPDVQRAVEVGRRPPGRCPPRPAPRRRPGRRAPRPRCGVNRRGVRSAVADAPVPESWAATVGRRRSRRSGPARTSSCDGAGRSAARRRAGWRRGSR